MNYRMVWQILGRVLCTEAVLLLIPLCTALIYGESILPFLISLVLCGAVGGLLLLLKPKNSKIFAKEGFISVALSWVVISMFGAVPFVICGDIPNYIDAVFETVSGFTTTGASIAVGLDDFSRGCLIWRSFTHWIGGMGFLVFIMAVMPMAGTRSMHIMRAEVPGPTVGKLVPNARKTARILYAIYICMTLLETVLLMFGGMDLFDALIHSFGTAGTGGFSNRSLSVGYYDSAYIDGVITVFMFLFGVNFNLYYLILLGRFTSALKSEELRWYAAISVFAILTITFNILPLYDGSFLKGLRYASFQVGSIISTTGFVTADFELWPEYSRWMLVLLTFTGACAGSTGGGLKISRIMLLFRAAKQDIRKLHRPHNVSLVMLEGKAVPDGTVRTTLVFFFCYLALLLVGTLFVSLNGFDFITNFTATLTCISNVGPGLAVVGPRGGFSEFAGIFKIFFSFCMLFGRLEVFPMLMLFSPAVWRKQ